MGLLLKNMSNLHAPTVLSGPTTAPPSNGNVSPADTIAEVHRRKQDIEEELSVLGGVLESQGVDMKTNLLAPDGFPRADIDVAQIRMTRTRIIRLRNDYQDLMAKAEKLLHDHFATLNDEDETSDLNPDSAPESLASSVPEVLDTPFAKVNSVVDNSPAASAGLKAGDLIRKFGYVSVSNHDSLKNVAECVKEHEGRNILVKIARSAGSSQLRELQLNLTPQRNWGGQGLLGCHILPV